MWDVFFSPSELTNTDVCFTLQFSLAVHSVINIRTAVHVVLLYAPSVWPVCRPYLYTMTGCNCIFSPYKFFSRFLVRDISSKIQSSCCMCLEVQRRVCPVYKASYFVTTYKETNHVLLSCQWNGFLKYSASFRSTIKAYLVINAPARGF